MLELFLVLATPPAAPATVLPGDELPRLEMAPVDLPLRSGGTVTVERGILTVPIVRSDPQSRRITVDVWRFPAAAGADPETPPVFQLHGGPGWEGMEPADVDYENDVLPFVRHADLVVVGQRGIGTSEPNTICGSVPAPPEGVELSQAEADDALRAACFACREYWESQGYDLSGFSVVEAAGDVDDVRRLLGYEEISLWGGSFGSHWGMAVMRYHPTGVARAVLTGMEGPDHTYDMPSGVLASLERLAAAAERSESLAAHVPEDGLIAALEGVIARLEEEPVEIEVDGTTVRIDADDVRDASRGYSARASSRSGARTWPADVLALHRGEYEGIARAKLQRGGADELPTASFFMLDCGSGISPERLEELRSDPAAAVVGDLGHWYETACAAWGADLGEEFRAGSTTSIPTVIVHGTWDVNTPLDNALELLPSFENAHFVLVVGGSHGALDEALGADEEFRAELWEFVVSGDASGLPSEVRLPPLDWARPR